MIIMSLIPNKPTPFNPKVQGSLDEAHSIITCLNCGFAFFVQSHGISEVVKCPRCGTEYDLS